MLKKVNNLFFEFLWNEPGKTKRNVTGKSQKAGGLRIVRIENFLDSVKLCWLCRIITGNKKW